MDAADGAVDSVGQNRTERCGAHDVSGECNESFEKGAEGDTLGAGGNDVEGGRVLQLTCDGAGERAGGTGVAVP